MARKREVSFFHDVQTDEIFEAFLEQEELISMDLCKSINPVYKNLKFFFYCFIYSFGCLLCCVWSSCESTLHVSSKESKLKKRTQLISLQDKCVLANFMPQHYN